MGRVLGSYSASSDILIGLTADQPDFVKPIRLTWDESTTWASAVTTLHTFLATGTQYYFTIDTIRRVLGLNDTQTPCLAFFHPASHSQSTLSNVDFPLLLVSNLSENFISLRASENHVHTSMLSLLLSQIIDLSSHGATDPDSKLATLPPLSADLMSSFDHPSSKHDLIRKYVSPVAIATDYILPHLRSSPNATAVLWYPNLSDDQSIDSSDTPEVLSYSELHQRANKFARWLITRGLQSEDRVAVCMDRNLMFHIVLFGILRAGACYVPIDPELPEARKSFIAQDSGARFVLVSSQSGFHLENSINVFTEEVQQEIHGMSADDVPTVSADTLSYMLYTSGTTGNPKGCLLTHEGLAEVVMSLASFSYDVRMDNIREGKFLSIASVAFDVHLCEIFVSLTLGMTLVSARRSLLLENLAFYLIKLGITHVGLVPSLIDATMGSMQEEEGHDMKLRYIGSGGEKISDTILQKWANHPKVRLVNFYGPSEVTIGCSGRFMDKNTPKNNVGRPFASVSAYVVDPALNITLRGGIGELVVAGPLVGRGYHGRPDLTSKVFLNWPNANSWAYRTGDLVRMMPDGTMEIIGRIDTQIKLRGVRIEAEGVSAVLQRSARESHGLSLDAGTVVGTHPAIGASGVPQLVSFVAWNATVPIATRRTTKPTVVSPFPGLFPSLREACERELASYMRPSHIIPLSFLPLNANGKADAKVLSGIFHELEFDVMVKLARVEEQGAKSSDTQEPMTELEEKIVSVLREHGTIPFDTFYPDTNLFACGLDSLSLIRFTSGVNSSFSSTLSVADVMKTPTIRGIASLVHIPTPAASSSSRNSGYPSYVERFSTTWMKKVKEAYPASKVEHIYPPFPIQEGVLYGSQGPSTMYIQHVVLRLHSSSILEKLRGAWDSVMAKTEILRTVFFFSKALIQVVLRPDACNLLWEEHETPLKDDSAFSNWFFSEKATKVSTGINSHISSIPPFRINVFRAPHGDRLVLSIHHALFDGISLPILLKNVEDEFNAVPYPSGSPVAVVLDEMAKVDLSKAREFWVKSLDGFDWSEVAFRSPSSSSPTRRFAVPFQISLSSLNAKLAVHKVTLQALLSSTFAALLATHMYHSNDIIFGVIRSGRLLPVEDVDKLLYPMLTVLPVRINFGKSGDLLQDVQRNISAAVEYEPVSLSKVQNWIRPGESLFETLFSVVFEDEERAEIWDITQSELKQSDYVLSVEVALSRLQDSLVLKVAYSEDIVSADTVHAMLHDFERIAVGLIDQGGRFALDGHEANGASLSPPSVSGKTLNGNHEAEDAEAGDDETIQQLRSTIADFLDVSGELIAEDTSFFVLGLDSIKSVGLSRTLRQSGFVISAIELMRRSSLRKLSRYLTATKGVNGGEVKGMESFQRQCELIRKNLDVESLQLTPDDHIQVFPTSILQAGMLSQTVNSSGKLYVHGFPVRLPGDVDVDLLHKSWETIAKRSSILRTSFHYLVNLGSWVQAVHSSPQMDWLSDTYCPSKSIDSLLTEAISSVDLSDESAFCRPPLRLRLLVPEGASGQATPYLIVIMHHALYDGLSLAKLFQEVEDLYYHRTLAVSPQFNEVLPQILHQEQLGTTFWIERLRGYHQVTLPRTQTSETVKTHTASCDVSFDPVQLKKFYNHVAVTPQCLGQAAWAKLLAVLLSSADVVFGHVISGRTVEGSEDVIGPMLNSIPCRVQLNDVSTNRDLLRAIHHGNVTALQWHHASLRSIQSSLGLANLWDSLFLFQPFIGTNSQDWSWDVVGELDANVQYPLNMEFYERESGFAIKAVCLSSHMSAEALANALSRLEGFMKTFVERPDDEVSKDLPDIMNGKVSELEETSSDTQHDESEHIDIDQIPPSILAILSSVTGTPVEELDLTRTLVTCGIDSITAIQLSAKCRRAGVMLNVGDIIASHTLHDLVKKVVVSNKPIPAQSNYDPALAVVPQAERDAISLRIPDKLRDEVESIGVATSGMKWLIAGWQGSRGTGFQHIFPYSILESVDTTQLRASWIALLERHAILRSTFASAESVGEPRIVTYNTRLVDSSWSEEPFDDTADDQCIYNKMLSILSSPPPMYEPQARAILLRSTKKRYLFIRLHHFQYDAWSLRVILDDFSALYSGMSPSSSTDYNAFQAVSLSSFDHLSEQRAYWHTTIPPSTSPAYFPMLNHDCPSSQGRTIYMAKAAISAATVHEERARMHNMSLQSILLACWARLQTLYTSSESATFGLWHAGRSGAVDAIEKLALPCMNVLPLHVQVRNDSVLETARQILKDLRNRTAVIEQTDLQKIDKWVGGNGKPLCNVFVNIIKIAPDANDSRDRNIIEPLSVPYFVPDVLTCAEDTFVHELPVTKLVQDDVMIDILTDKEHDTILMSVECAADTMSMTQAKELVEQWSRMVEGEWE
ncbi:hypothetical protein SERLA73DRAFT_172154 [Serpula lacrymans var. lacrymans S7.3]|uniref:Carrier domain-containing protein n=1 Tax=Serpula lacrymans var. lacrymans (strain S7.3) TaxID=936435 RepID=F8QEI5_SERL3|nr:hypothetical protein SERLA73DRAFT_172154 [Serpula lacrymans var. lacrymans S7.3]